MTGVTSESGNGLLPVLPLKDLCLFPEASLAVVVAAPGALRALEIAKRTGSRVLALAQRESASSPRDLHEMLDVAAQHNVKAITERFPMAKANDAVAKVKKNQVRYRAVLAS